MVDFLLDIHNFRDKRIPSSIYSSQVIFKGHSTVSLIIGTENVVWSSYRFLHGDVKRHTVVNVWLSHVLPRLKSSM